MRDSHQGKSNDRGLARPVPECQHRATTEGKRGTCRRTSPASFLFSTPGWEPSLGGFPALSTLPGQFLLKDVVLLGALVWSLGEALAAREA